MVPFDVYPLWDIEPVRGEGCYLYDKSGVRYLDFYGGHAVISVGHAHPRYVQRITEQLHRLAFYSNAVQNSLQKQLAERLGHASGYPHFALFLCNSGAEANENAIKLASFDTGKKKVLAFSKAFHGRTSGAVAATDNPKILAPFNRTPNVEFIPLNDVEAVEQKLKTGEFCAAIIEGIQGVGGILLPDDPFLQQLSERCRAHGVRLILDEIQSGYGRSGKFFAHQWAGIEPDLITTAKGMANGFPIGGVLISPAFKPLHGMLGTTFGGAHLACAAALAVLEIFEEEHILGNVADMGALLMNELRALPGVKELRGRGLIVGIEMEKPAGELRKKLLFEHKIFTGAAGAHVIRLLPPLCIGRQQVSELMAALRAVVENEKTLTKQPA
ncbi:MAG: aminotransferase class III-fold pyridoxal phosphate-dependent enzyme [Prevotellaceae bacterium]|jgi:acetylornithine aminotransferase|nr:aminotransferase class III-fold pyridoxal phosphate-dependent enzyme [Prevotellaceae bacterium]